MEEGIKRATKEQSLALSVHDANHRLVITGCAGTGKTVTSEQHLVRIITEMPLKATAYVWTSLKTSLPAFRNTIA